MALQNVYSRTQGVPLIGSGQAQKECSWRCGAPRQGGSPTSPHMRSAMHVDPSRSSNPSLQTVTAPLLFVGSLTAHARMHGTSSPSIRKISRTELSNRKLACLCSSRLSVSVADVLQNYLGSLPILVLRKCRHVSSECRAAQRTPCTCIKLRKQTT